MKLLSGLGFLLLIVLQGTWLPWVQVLGVMPDLVLVAVTSWALLGDPRSALALALGGGLLLDLIGGTPLGLSSSALLLAVLACGWWRSTIAYAGIGLFIAAAVVGTFLYDGLTLVVMQSLHELVVWPVALSRVVLPSAVLNGVAAAPMGFVLSGLAERLGLFEPAAA